MSTITVITRLQLNFQDVGGIRAYLFEPVQPIDLADLPASYPVMVGQGTRQVPASSQSAGQYLVERRYIYRVLTVALQAASMDSLDDGAYIDATSCALLDTILDYFMLYPRLNTSTNAGDLPGITQDIEVQDSGLVTRPGPGGAQYRAVDYTFVIAERRYPRAPRFS